MEATAPTVFLVDDDRGIVRSLERVLVMAGHRVRTWTSAIDFLRDHDPSVPGCLVTDLSMPDVTGMELLISLHEVAPIRYVILVSGRGDIPTSVKAMRAGAVSFLSKPVQSADLLAAVAEALEKDRTSRAFYEDQLEITTRLQSLTPREREVLDLVAAGMLNKQIAAQLGTAEKTVKVHRGRLMEKMKVRSAAALVSLLGRVPEFTGHEAHK